MTSLVITRGLPGSGKSTWAREWVAEDPHHRAEVNRDQVRMMLHNVVWSGDHSLEVQVTVAQHAMIRDLLGQNIDVVCSDTNLRQRYVRDLVKIAARTGADVVIQDMTGVPLEVCIERDAVRGLRGERTVGEAVIRDMHRRHIAPLKGAPMPLPAETEDSGEPEFVEHIPGLPTAVLVDIDGTVALKGARNPFDETRVHEDRPNLPVIQVVQTAYLSGDKIISMSGRTDGCRDATVVWLDTHVPVRFEALHMRRAGDMRKDSIVKRELFDRHVRGRYNIRYVLDDRDQVVRMWREELGLTCLQVAPGNF